MTMCVCGVYLETGQCVQATESNGDRIQTQQRRMSGPSIVSPQWKKVESCMCLSVMLN